MNANSTHVGDLHRANLALKAERDQLRKDLEFCTRSKITVIHRHGAGNILLQKLTQRWAVRLFCRGLCREAVEHITQR